MLLPPSALAADKCKSSCNGATPLGLKMTLHTQNCSPQESDLGPDPPCQARVSASACCCNSSCHGHSFIQQGASATDSDWYIGCGGVFNVCEGPLWNDHMHTPVACSHSNKYQVLDHFLTGSAGRCKVWMLVVHLAASIQCCVAIESEALKRHAIL